MKEYGIWIVTSTHATKKCAINMWTRRGRGLKVGFAAEVAGIGKAGPSGEWYRSQTDEGWGEYTTEVCRRRFSFHITYLLCLFKKGDDISVVFFGGLKFQYTWRFGNASTSRFNFHCNLF